MHHKVITILNVTHHHHFFDEEENKLIDIHQDDVDEVNIKKQSQEKNKISRSNC